METNRKYVFARGKHRRISEIETSMYRDGEEVFVLILSRDELINIILEVDQRGSDLLEAVFCPLAEMVGVEIQNSNEW